MWRSCQWAQHVEDGWYLLRRVARVVAGRQVGGEEAQRRAVPVDFDLQQGLGELRQAMVAAAERRPRRTDGPPVCVVMQDLRESTPATRRNNPVDEANRDSLQACPEFARTRYHRRQAHKRRARCARERSLAVETTATGAST